MSMNFVNFNSREIKNGNVFCYRSSLSVFEEGIFDGVPVSFGYNTAGYPLDVLSNCPTRLNPYEFIEPFCFNFEFDGETVCRRLKLESVNESDEDGKKHIAVSFLSEIKKIRIVEHTILDGSAMFSRHFEIENLSDKSVNLSRLVLHGGGVEKTDFDDRGWSEKIDCDNIYSLGYFENDTWGREGEFEFHDLLPGSVNIDCCFNRSRFRQPAVFIKNNLTGDIYYIQVGWSAGVRYTVDYNSGKNKDFASLSYTAEITGYKPLISLKAGEKFITPEIHFCAVHGNLDDAINEGIKHFRKSVLCLSEADGTSLYVGAGMGAEHDMTVETSKVFAKQMHEMGAEVFIVDAGWVCPPDKEMQWYDYNGLNVFNSDRYKNGISELSDYCHSIGMKFALWMEPERFGKLSGIDKLHPEWIIGNLFDEKAYGFIDMTNEDAVNWVENEITRIISEYKLDLLRIDYNVNGNETFAFKDCGSGNEECVSLRHFTAVYGMYSRLKKRFPDVVFENCAGGGGRTDLGMLRNFNHTWVSDNQKMPESIIITNGMTMVLPPERVDRLFAGMGCHTRGEIFAHMRNTMLTHMSLNVIAPAYLTVNPEIMDFVRHSVEIYKKYIRPILPICRIYHHTPDSVSAGREGYRILEITSPDNSVGFITVFTETFSKKERIIVYPRGINPAYAYSVYTDNAGTEYDITGSDAIANGINVNINSSLSSELIIYKKK